MNDRLILNGRLCLLALLLLVPCLCSPLQAQIGAATKVYFPHVVSSADEETRIFIFNPNAASALVSLTYRDRDGLVPAGVPNPVTFSVAAHGLSAQTAGNLFGSGLLLDGSVEVSSAVPGLVVQSQVYDTGLTLLGGLDDAEDSMNLVFPVVPGISEGIAEIDLFNPNARETSVELKLWSLDGKVLAVAAVRVPANGAYRGLVTNIFPTWTEFRSASHITALSKSRNVLSVAQTVAGTSLISGFSSTPASVGYFDLAAINALPVTEVSNSGAVPHFHTGGQQASTLALANLEAATVYVTLTLVGNNGTNLGVRMVGIPGLGGLRAPLQTVMPELGTQEQEGWLLIQASGRLAGGIVYGRNDAESLAIVPIQRFPKTEFVFTQATQGNGLSTELELINPTPATSIADIRVVSSDGSTMAANQVTIGPSKRVTVFMDRLFPELSPPWSGVLHVKSTGALFATATIWSDAGNLASNISPRDVSFPDRPLTSFAVTGRVTLNNEPAAGFRVALTGATTKYATVNADGNYAFTNLAAGSYTLAVAQAGFQFIPAQVSFSLTNASKRQDFQGFTAPDAILVQPDAIPVGSPDTPVKIFGKDFNATSEAFAGPLRLSTTFVDPTQLEAVLPAYLTAAASRLQIVVITNASDASRRVSQGYPVIAYVNKPVLASVATGGNIVEGSPAGAIALQGSGFLEGAKVRVNGSAEGIQVTLVSSTQLVATVPSTYFEQGGIYPVSVENPYPSGAESNVQLLTVYYPPPAVENVVPGTCVVKLESDAAPLNLEVFGYGFRRGAVVLFDGKPLITTYCETDAYCLDTHLFAKVPPTMLRMAGFAKVEVKNPDPSLAVSEAVFLDIDGLQPTVTAVQPGSATLTTMPGEFTMPVIVDGTNFGPETFLNVGQVGSGKDPVDGKIEVLSTTRLILSIAVSYPDSLGEWWVQACNPPPGGGCSDPVTFTITETSFVSAPFLTSLSPSSIAAGSRSFTLTVNGSNFKSGTVINFRTTPLVTTWVNKNQVRAVVPASLIRIAGKIPVSVTNPDAGGTSNKLFMDVR